MAAIPVVIQGTRTYSDLTVGGGPMPGGPSVSPPIYYPPPGSPAHPIVPPGGYPEQPPSGGQPPGIWGGAPVPTPTPPIYIPITPPPDSGLSPEHPIYIPVQPPPGIWGGGNMPIVGHPIRLPLTDEQKEKLKQFLTGNLPPSSGPVS